MSSFVTGLGQDSHEFGTNENKPLIIGGVTIPGYPGFLANSDGDIVFHAITNAISSITTINILGTVADDLCRGGVVDSEVYLSLALNDLAPWKISHVSISIEGQTPKLAPYIDEIRASVSRVLEITHKDVGITATTGENLSAFGRSQGMQALVIITCQK